MYPVNSTCYCPVGTDRRLCHQRLSDNSIDLFQGEGGGVDTLSISLDTNGSMSLVRGFRPSQAVEKEGGWDGSEAKEYRDFVFIVNSAFSWSQLSITEFAFRTLLDDVGVFTPFLEVVHTFGRKTSDKQRAKDTTFYRRHPSSTYEFCYTVRYFELNGRGRGSPWSLRQTGVYHRCDPDRKSTWILLNHSSYIHERMTSSLREDVNSARLSETCRAFLPHVFILASAVRNWSQYIEYQRGRLRLFEDKVYGCITTSAFKVDVNTLLKDVHKLSLLTDGLAVARAAIVGQKRVLSEFARLQIKLCRPELEHEQCECDTETHLETLSHDVQSYLEDIETLERGVSRVSELIMSAVAARGNGQLQSIVTSIQTSLMGIERGTNGTSLGTSELIHLTAQGQQDSTKLKALAHIAALFLPPSVIAALFSSTIFNDSGVNTSNLRLYFVITGPLVLAIGLVLVLVERGASIRGYIRNICKALS